MCGDVCVEMLIDMCAAIVFIIVAVNVVEIIVMVVVIIIVVIVVIIFVILVFVMTVMFELVTIVIIGRHTSLSQRSLRQSIFSLFRWRHSCLHT